MAVSLKTDLRFPESGQHGHGSRIIQKISLMLDESINLFKEKIEIFNTYFSKSSNDISSYIRLVWFR